MLNATEVGRQHTILSVCLSSGPSVFKLGLVYLALRKPECSAGVLLTDRAIDWINKGHAMCSHVHAIVKVKYSTAFLNERRGSSPGIRLLSDPINFKNFKLYVFTRITHGYKLATRWSCWVENKYETFSVRENHWNLFPGWKTLTYSHRLWDSNPRPRSNSVVVITPRLAHRLNHLATEHSLTLSCLYVQNGDFNMIESDQFNQIVQ